MALDKPLNLFLLLVYHNGNGVAFVDIESLNLIGPFVDNLLVSIVAVVHYCVNVSSVHVGLCGQVGPRYESHSEVRVLAGVPVHKFIVEPAHFGDWQCAGNHPSCPVLGVVIFGEEVAGEGEAVEVDAVGGRLEDEEGAELGRGVVVS